MARSGQADAEAARPLPRARLLLEWLAIGLGASLLVASAFWAGWSERADRLLYDLVAPLHAPPPDPRILIIAIDNHSLAQIGPWPWPRDVHAAALNRLEAARPAAILYDVLFLERSRQDEALAAAMRARGNVYLPLLVDGPGWNGANVDIRLPVEPIRGAAAGIGSANLLLDADGHIRRFDLASRGEAGRPAIPHVAELMHRRVAGRPSSAFAHAAGGGAPVWLPFQSFGAFPSLPFVALLRGEAPADLLRGRILLFGVTATGLGDAHNVSSALGGPLPGVEVQANLLSALLADRLIRPLDARIGLALALAPLWLLLLAFWRLRPAHSLLLALALLLGTLATSGALLALAGLWWRPAATLLGLLLVYPLWGWRRLATIGRFLTSEVDQMSAARDLPSPPASSAPGWGGDAIAADAARLHEAIGQMRLAARERQEMLQFLSHDMRAPQASILALAAHEGEAEPARLERIGRYARHTLKLADDFVQLARLQSRAASPDEPVDLGDAMAQAADIVWPLARSRGIVLQASGGDSTSGDCWAGDCWARGDGAALVRAFTNLLDNAVRHAPEGSTVRYGVRIADPPSLALCEVIDAGPGLPPERATDPFVRFGAVAGGGSGLGLAYVKAVAQRHGGRAAYEPAPGGGSCFSMLLPLDPE